MTCTTIRLSLTYFCALRHKPSNLHKISMYAHEYKLFWDASSPLALTDATAVFKHVIYTQKVRFWTIGEIKQADQ